MFVKQSLQYGFTSLGRRFSHHSKSQALHLLSKDKSMARVISPYNSSGLISKIVGYFNDNGIDLYSIVGKVETRKADQTELCTFDVSFDNREAKGVENLEKSLEKLGLTFRLQEPPKVHWFPTSLNDLNNFGFDRGLDLVDIDEIPHKGSGNKYRQKREALVKQLKSHKVLDTLPDLEWDSEETKVWNKMFSLVVEKRSEYSCKEFNDHFDLMLKEKLFNMYHKPDLNKINTFLQNRCNWRLKAVGSNVSHREFLNALALRTLCFSMHMRDPDLSEDHPESDIIHQLLNQIPNLFNPRICNLLQKLGELSLGANDLQIKELMSIYWHNFEFGLIQEDGKNKFLGAGYMGSTAHLDELERSVSSSEGKIRKLDLSQGNVPYAEFKLNKAQPVYFSVHSLEELENQIHNYAQTFYKPFNLRYNFGNNTYETDRAVVAVIPNTKNTTSHNEKKSGGH